MCSLGPALACVVDPVLGRAKQEHRDDEDHHKQQPRHGRAIGHVLEGKEGLVQIQIVEHRRPTRSASTVVDHQRHQEELEEPNHPQDQVVEDHRRNHGEGHVAEGLPTVGPIHFRRIIQRGGHPLQTGQEDEHGVANAPDAHDDVGGIDPGHAVGPGGQHLFGDAHGQQGPVNPTGFRIEHTTPEEDSGHEGHDVGHVEGGTEEHRPSQVGAVHQDSDAERQQDANRQRDKSKFDGDPQGPGGTTVSACPYLRIVEELDVVSQPDELGLIQYPIRDIDVGEAKD